MYTGLGDAETNMILAKNSYTQWRKKHGVFSKKKKRRKIANRQRNEVKTRTTEYLRCEKPLMNQKLLHENKSIRKCTNLQVESESAEEAAEAMSADFS